MVAAAALLAWPAAIHGQIERSDRARLLYERAQALFEQERSSAVDSARALWTEAAELFRRSGRLRDEGLALWKIANAHEALGHVDSAGVYLRRAILVQRAARDFASLDSTLNALGAIELGAGRPDSALASFGLALTLALERRDRGAEGTALANLGYVHYATGHRDSALVLTRQSLTISREEADSAAEAGNLNTIGAIFVALGRPDSAIVYLRAADGILQGLGDRENAGTVANNIGALYRELGVPDSALAYYARSLALSREERNRQAEAQTLNNAGMVYRDLGRADSAGAHFGAALVIARELRLRALEGLILNNMGINFWQRRLVGGGTAEADSAIAHFRSALTIRREVGDRAGEGNTLHNLGTIFTDLRRPDSAFAYYTRALELRRETRDRPGEAVTVGNLGWTWVELGRLDSALVHLQIALGLARQLGNRILERAALLDIGDVHRIRASPPALALATAYYDSAAAVASVISASAGGDANRVSLAERSRRLFGGWALTWLARASADAGLADRGRLAALAVAEAGRAQALLDLMRTRTHAADGPVPLRPIRQAGADPAAEARLLTTALARRGTNALVYFAAFDTLLVWAIRATGEVELFRHGIRADTLAELVAALRAGDGGGAGRRGGSAFRDIEALDAPAGIGIGAAAVEAARRRLGDLLLPAAFLESLSPGADLLIVPDGSLGLVPFAVFPSIPDGDPLGIRFALRYAPSLASLVAVEAATLPEPARVAARDALVVGNPTMPSVSGGDGQVPLPPLSGAEAEGRWLGERLNVAPLLGQTATEAEVRRRIASATLVHLATHGLAYSSDARARDSFVALGPGEDHDGLLTIAEVLDELPTLRAELVVLSACETGLGNLKQAEGTLGLQRAFLARGARSVLVTLWGVDDEATQRLIRAFYDHWLEDDDRPTKAEALRRAQSDLRATPAFDHPRFWAAFQLVGAR
jgi:tetratricopeptide (TPR) repeat protein